MHVVERGIDEALVVGDVIVRVVEILNDQEVRVAISSPNGRIRYQEVILRLDGREEAGAPAEKLVSAASC
jgi:hypothetical protein